MCVFVSFLGGCCPSVEDLVLSIRLLLTITFAGPALLGGNEADTVASVCIHRGSRCNVFSDSCHILCRQRNWSSIALATAHHKKRVIQRFCGSRDASIRPTFRKRKHSCKSISSYLRVDRSSRVLRMGYTAPYCNSRVF